MKRTILILSCLFILAFAAIWINRAVIVTEEEFIVGGEPYIKGEIVSLTEEEILVSEGVEGEYEGDIENLIGNAIWLKVTEQTKITGANEEEIKFRDLTASQSVEVWTTGLILESYPARGTAAKIKLTQ